MSQENYGRLSDDEILNGSPLSVNDTIKCQQCSHLMYRTKITDKNISLQVLGIIVFLIGLGLLFVFPIGTIAGLFLMVGSARMGYSKKNVWKCSNCGYFFEYSK